MCEVYDQAHDSVVHRTILHVVQRRVTAAEVAEGYSHPDGTLIPEDADNVVLVLYHHGLRNLQLQLVRIECRPTQDSLDFVALIRILELPHRQVHAHRHRGRVAVLVAPLCCSAASFLQHPLPKGDDEAGLLGDLDELRGYHVAASRAFPPHRGLHLGYRADIQRNLGLIVDLIAL
jgi:hypothetical protein